MSIQVSRTEFEDWMENKVTITVFDTLNEQREELIDLLANGSSLDSRDTTAYYIGRIQGINDLLKVAYDD